MALHFCPRSWFSLPWLFSPATFTANEHLQRRKNPALYAVGPKAYIKGLKETSQNE